MNSNLKVGSKLDRDVICRKGLLFVVFYFSILNIALTQSLIKAKVADLRTDEPLPFCHILNIKTQDIYITNSEGEFQINDPHNLDVLKITYVGYKDKFISIDAILTNKVILLESDIYTLDEVNILPNDERLIKLIYEVGRNLKNSKKFTSKSYLELYSEDQIDHLELLQCYYNVIASGANITDFNLKAGKISLTTNKENSFVNLDATYALVQLDPVRQSKKYMENPLSMSIKSLKKKYYVQEIKASGDNVIHLTFEPFKMSDSLDLFSGEIWIRKTDNQPQKIRLFTSRAGVHPFNPIRQTDSLKRVGIEMVYYFNEVNQNHRLTLLTFKYAFDYLSNRKMLSSQEDSIFSLRKITTEGLVHLYDDKELFLLPSIDYNANHNDYRKVSMIPFDKTFWDRTPSIPLTELQKMRHNLFIKNGISLNFQKPIKSKNNFKEVLEHGIFEHNNIIWDSSAVIRLKPNSTLDIAKADLHIQLYLDVNKYNDTFHFTTKTILDVFKTQYALENSPTSLAFLNIYFDLAETVRIKMQKELANVDNIKTIEKIHLKYNKILLELINEYKYDLNFGKNIRNMTKWNDKIKSELNRDHIKNFQVIIPKY